MNFKYKRVIALCITAVLLLSGCKSSKETERNENFKESKIVEAAAATKQKTTEAITEKITQRSEIETTQETIQTESESETIADAQNLDDYVSFLFAGDVCLEEDGFVIDYYDEVGGDLTQCVSPYLLERMRFADIFMLNHEYSISNRGSRLDKYYTFRANRSEERRVGKEC